MIHITIPRDRMTKGRMYRVNADKACLMGFVHLQLQHDRGYYALPPRERLFRFGGTRPTLCRDEHQIIKKNRKLHRVLDALYTEHCVLPMGQILHRALEQLPGWTVSALSNATDTWRVVELSHPKAAPAALQVGLSRRCFTEALVLLNDNYLVRHRRTSNAKHLLASAAEVLAIEIFRHCGIRAEFVRTAGDAPIEELIGEIVAPREEKTPEEATV